LVLGYRSSRSMNGRSIELQQTVRLARWSAGLGTIGLLTAVFGVGVLLALAAILCAAIALNQLSATTAPDAHGVAVVGLLAGVLALLVFPLLLATAVPKFLSARKTAAQERCYSNLLAIDAAKEHWAQQHGARTGSRVSDDELFTRGALVPREPECPSGGRYVLRPIGQPPRCSVPAHNDPPGPKRPPAELRFSMNGYQPRD
jgi:hypothetical protein